MDRPEPNAVYKFERATVRIYGTCTNIREETEKFLKQVVNKRRAKNSEKQNERGQVDASS